MMEEESRPTPVHRSSFSKSCDNIKEQNEISMTISAPGKVILYGEHSVVYGKLAVAASLGLRTKVTLTETELKDDQQNYIKVELPDINLVHIYDLKDLQYSLLAPVLPLTKSPSNYNWKMPHLLSYDELLHIIVDYITRSSGSFPLTRQQSLSLCSFFYLLTGIFSCVNIDLKPFTLHVETQLSLSSGSGSSASYSVALAATFIHYLRLFIRKRDIATVSKDGYKPSKLLHMDLKHFTDEELDVISKWAYVSEKIMHGTPSGIDNTVCSFGSLVEFRKSTGAKLIKFDYKLKLLLINTKVQRDTKRLVNNVAVLRECYPTIVEPILQAIDELAVKAVQNLLALNNNVNEQESRHLFEKLGVLTDMNQHMLEAIQVSHPTIEKICKILKKFHLNGKLTGAGGGGYVIALIPPYTSNSTIEELMQKLTVYGFDSAFTDLAGPGVLIDSCNMDCSSL